MTRLSLKERMLLGKLPKKTQEDRDLLDRLLRIREIFKGRIIEIKKAKDETIKGDKV